MNEKTKKILKVSAIALGEMALLTLGFAVGACSAKAGTKQQTAITTPVAKSLIARTKKAILPNVEYIVDIGKVVSSAGAPQSNSNISVSGVVKLGVNGVITQSSFTSIYYDYNGGYPRFQLSPLEYAGFDDLGLYVSLGTGDGVLVFGDYDYGDEDVEFDTCTFVFEGTPQFGDYQSFFESILTNPSSDEPETSQPESSTPEVSLPETKEKIVLNSSYDFRRWFGNVDPTTGAIQFKLPTGISLYSVRVGGLEWQNLGNERIYNCIEFTLQPLNASNALAVSDNLAKTAESLYGEKYTEFCMLSGVYYSYQSGYDGTYTVIQDSALPSVDYRDRIYSMPMVSAQLDGTANNVNALDIRNCVIPSIYRSFGIVEDSGVIFSTNGYSSVTLRQLLGMDFSSVVNYSEGTASAFSLLTQAFGSVAGLLAVQVLPNITLGLLLFLPLIAAVIVLIIKAVKK